MCKTRWGAANCPWLPLKNSPLQLFGIEIELQLGRPRALIGPRRAPRGTVRRFSPPKSAPKQQTQQARQGPKQRHPGTRSLTPLLKTRGSPKKQAPSPS